VSSSRAGEWWTLFFHPAPEVGKLGETFADVWACLDMGRQLISASGPSALANASEAEIGIESINRTSTI
jgi:hypothetical protein